MGDAAVARQPCYLIPPPRFRSGALRPTLSSGLPFTGSFLNRRLTQTIAEYSLKKGLCLSVAELCVDFFLTQSSQGSQRKKFFSYNSEHSVRDYHTMSKRDARRGRDVTFFASSGRASFFLSE